MSSNREELSKILHKILGSDYVYFDPPESKQIHYPCIIYQRSSGDTDFANNVGYRFTKRYQITVIAKDPDVSARIMDKLAKLPMCTYDRHYTSDNLHHDIFNLYY